MSTPIDGEPKILCTNCKETKYQHSPIKSNCQGFQRPLSTSETAIIEMHLRNVAKAALRMRIAFWVGAQNECEVANGGRDWGQEALDKELEDATNQLDETLEAAFGGGFDLNTPEEAWSKLETKFPKTETTR